METQDSANSELWANYRAHYPDPNRPVHSRLMKVYVDRLSRLLELAPCISGPAGGWLAFLPELENLLIELKEISTYLGENPLFGPGPPGWMGQFLVEEGFSFAYARDAEQSVERIPRGRPVSVRFLAVNALEIRMSQGKSWSELATKLCPCGETDHTLKCSERIRVAVWALEEVLKKYEIRF